TLTRLNQPDRLLLELKRVTPSLRLRHLRFPFALQQLAKGYVLRGQGHTAAKLDQSRFSRAVIEEQNQVPHFRRSRKARVKLGDFDVHTL
ncbi:MAG TPA: hypothetical protein VFC39_18475, partial [Acidobacteriaceae bacterium]|nr:hypothetical protein [Acidobacteriaceae bacterium]